MLISDAPLSPASLLFLSFLALHLLLQGIKTEKASHLWVYVEETRLPRLPSELKVVLLIHCRRISNPILKVSPCFNWELFQAQECNIVELWCRLSAAFWNVICSLTSIIIPSVFLTFLALYEIMRHSLHLQQLWVLLQNFNSLIFVSNFIPAIYLFILIVQSGNKLLSLLNNETRLALIFLQNGNKVR